MILYEVLLVAYLIVAVLLVGFVLLQQGKGADMGASFGAGGSNTIFGSSGSGNFMTRSTAILATLFFTISLIIGGITAGTSTAVDEFETIQPIADEQAPALENDGTEFPVAIEDAEAKVEELPEPPKAEDKP
jgi:preprotein translocase subunit SecG